jgi:hypothetical protein
MVFRTWGPMPFQQRLLPNREKKITRHSDNAAPYVSSFNLVNRYGQLAVHNTPLTESVKKAQIKKLPNFSNWSMPEQRVGYIKCKEHDFL